MRSIGMDGRAPDLPSCDWMVGHRSALESVLSDDVLARIPIRLVFPDAKIIPRRVRALIEFLALRASRM